MIKKCIKGDVFETTLTHIAFAVNTEGYNDSGFAGKVSRIWPELANTGPKNLGDTMSKTIGGKTYHALVCHSLKIGGWSNTPKIVQECLNKLDVPETEPIATVLMGSGYVGRMSGADVEAIKKGMAHSNKTVVIYTLI
mgnify:CR=1 FL=1